jgi:hypothetical protein
LYFVQFRCLPDTVTRKLSVSLCTCVFRAPLHRPMVGQSPVPCTQLKVLSLLQAHNCVYAQLVIFVHGCMKVACLLSYSAGDPVVAGLCTRSGSPVRAGMQHLQIQKSGDLPLSASHHVKLHPMSSDPLTGTPFKEMPFLPQICP